MSSISRGFGPVFEEVGTEKREAMRRTHAPASIFVAAGAMLVMAIVFARMGAPGEFVAFAVLGAVAFIIVSLIARVHEDRLIEEERTRAEEEWTRREEERDRFKEEVARSVKESIKGTIKVRCRYCGGLNEEHDEKCESCGAPL